MVGILGVMGTYTYISETYKPVYSCSAIYVVTPRQSTGYVYTNRKSAERVVTSFQQLLYTDIMASRVREELHNPDYELNTRVEIIEETNLMKMTVTSSDPVTSFKVINIIMNNYDKLSEYLASDAVFDELKEPTVATVPDNILMPQNTSIRNGFISAFLALIVITVLSLFRNTIKNEDAVEDMLGANLIGSIFHEKKNKTLKSKLGNKVKNLLITSPIISQNFVESINYIRTKIEYEKNNNDGKNVFLVTSACQNEGKSTTALNIVLALAREGKSVIFIDADLRNPSIHSMLQLEKEKIEDITSLLRGECSLEDCLYYEDKLRFSMIMPSKPHQSTHEYTSSGAMKALIKECSKMADYVIIDTPPMQLVSDTEVMLNYADFAIIVIRQDYSFQPDIMNCIKNIETSDCKLMGCILNDIKNIKNTKNKYIENKIEKMLSGKAVSEDAKQ